MVHFLKVYIIALVFPKRNSLIVIQRVRSNFIYANLLKLLVLVRKKRTVYDLDDADYLQHNPKTIIFFVTHCHSISAGSIEIMNQLSRYNDSIFHITSPIVDLGIRKRKRNSIFTIGWIGGFHWGHKDSLFTFVFPAIQKVDFPCRLVLLGVEREQDRNEITKYFAMNTNLLIEMPTTIDWNNEKALQEKISSFDVGIATLENTEFHRSKSGIKAKQYLNNGIPVLCNDVPENNNVIIDAKNGFICQRPTDFLTKIKLINEMSDDQYWKLSSNAKKSSKKYSHKEYHHKWGHVML